MFVIINDDILSKERFCIWKESLLLFCEIERDTIYIKLRKCGIDSGPQIYIIKQNKAKQSFFFKLIFLRMFT